MIDWDDVEYASLVGGGSAITLIVVLVLAFYACRNDADCSKMHCEKGRPQLLKGACLCVEEAKP